MPFPWLFSWCAIFLAVALGNFSLDIQLFWLIIACTHWPVLTALIKHVIIATAIYYAADIVMGKPCTTCKLLNCEACKCKSFHGHDPGWITYMFSQLTVAVKSNSLCSVFRATRVNQKNRSVPLTLAGHAFWLRAQFADAVTEGGAARLGGVLRVGAWQAGAQASWCSIWFIGAGWTCW